MDDPYHEFIDRIICSDDYEKCRQKDEEGTCLASKSRTKCVHLFTCPAGYKRI
ncbi:MAG: hypothetical protein Q8N69_02120 [bacterium]|nr:hypothetical protein [bacterium]